MDESSGADAGAGARPRARPARRHRRRLRRVLAWAVTAALLAVAAIALAERWESVRDVGGLPGLGPVLAAVVAYAAGNALLAGNWAAVVAVTGRRVPWRAAAWIWSVSQLSRYTVALGQVGGRALAGRAYGVPAAAGALSTLVELGWMLCVTGAIVLATVPWWLPGAGDTGWLALAAAVPVAAIAAALAWPRGVTARLAGLARLVPFATAATGRVADALDRVALSRGTLASLTARYAANTALRLVAFLALFAAVGGDIPADGPLAAGAYALGTLAGALAVFAPGGLGVREGVSAVVLAPSVGGGPALALVASVRLLEVVAELAFLGVARAWRPRGEDRAPRS